MLIVALDRLIAIGSPFRYRNLNSSKSYKFITLAIPWIIGCSDAAAKYLLWTEDFTNTRIAVCTITNTRTAEYQSYKYYRSMTVQAVCYISAILIVKYKISKSNGNVQQLKKELGYKLTVTCAVEAVVYSCTGFLSQVYQTIFVINATREVRTAISPLATVLSLSGTTLRFIINYSLNKDFRNQTNKNCCCPSRNLMSNFSQTPSKWIR